MKKGIWIIVGVVLVLMLIIFIDNMNDQPDKEEAPASTTAPAASALNDFPMMPFTHVGGSSLVAKNLQDKTVLVLLQPDCDHCHAKPRRYKRT